MHEKWVKFAERPSGDMRIQLVDGPVFEVIITVFVSVFKRAPMLEDTESFRVEFALADSEQKGGQSRPGRSGCVSRTCHELTCHREVPELRPWPECLSLRRLSWVLSDAASYGIHSLISLGRQKPTLPLPLYCPFYLCRDLIIYVAPTRP